jgi:hypothetical protein
MNVSPLSASSRPKRRPKVGSSKLCKGTQWMVLVDATGIPLEAYLEVVPLADGSLLSRTLDTIAMGCAGPLGH